ncbi:sensor histidine kinase [Kitasatospora paracochleata]|uniref:histidine kinase n=2 Tax=Kitasatospora paracochleata TaxID=58354 RepID=A0ABT1J358_9ACTN|nr:sensor histidine kinase [Kitasatospora paracochleata]MCP2311858.1 signal transduction histidine kinase [Kitasatospora paracochleata]
MGGRQRPDAGADRHPDTRADGRADGRADAEAEERTGAGADGRADAYPGTDGTGTGTAQDRDASPWTHTDALVAVGACTLDLLTYLLFRTVERNEVPGLTGFLVVVLSALPLLARRRYPVAALAAVVLLEAAADLAAPPTSHFGAVLVVALFTAARSCPALVTAAASAATALVTLLAQSHLRLPGWQAAVATPLSVLLVAGAGVAVARWQREVAANRRLLADRAVADERRRIARELHDIVAHHITTMQLMAGGARANAGHPEVVRDALVTLESSGRMALREMRQLLDVLRAGDEPDTAPPSPQPGAEDLDRLVAEACRGGLPTDLGIEGPPRPLPPTVGLTVFRIAQEGLTNARKHAGPARAAVRLSYGPDRVTVEVRDDGGGTPGRAPAAASASGRAGYGLIGMRERVALHGGTLTAGPRPGGGFAVVADLPLTPDEVAEAAVQRGEATR